MRSRWTGEKKRIISYSASHVNRRSPLLPATPLLGNSLKRKLLSLGFFAGNMQSVFKTFPMLT